MKEAKMEKTVQIVERRTGLTVIEVPLSAFLEFGIDDPTEYKAVDMESGDEIDSLGNEISHVTYVGFPKF